MPANTSLVERAIINGKKWKLLTDEQKEVYKPSAVLLESYNRDLANWEASLTSEQSAQIKHEAEARRAKLVKFRLRKKCKNLGMPVRGAMSGWSVYIASLPVPRGDAPLQMYIKGLAAQWRKMPEQDKEKFEEKAVKAKTKYFDELEMWENNMIQEGHYDVIRKSSLPDYINPETRKPKQDKAKKRNSREKAKAEDSSWMREE